MADINKLKNRARREEQRQNWPLAIELYTRALRATERSSTVATDFSLYNRIGDIHLRLGEVETAVSCYEQAIARYAEHDLHTSAIALCNKILRIQPSRISGYQRLGELQLETGLLAEARVNYLRYATELLTRGRQDQAYTSLADYVERTGDLNSALRFAGALVANDRSAEALDLLLRLKHQAESGGRGAEALERPIAAIQRFKDRGPAVAAEYEAAVAVGELEAEMTEALEERREGGGGTIALLEAELDAAVGVTSESERAGVTSESAPLEEELAPEEEPWVVEPAAEEMAGIRPVAAEEPADEIEEEPEAEEEAEPEPEAEAEPWVVEPVAEEEPAPSGEEVTPETGPALERAFPVEELASGPKTARAADAGPYAPELPDAPLAAEYTSGRGRPLPSEPSDPSGGLGPQPAASAPQLEVGELPETESTPSAGGAPAPACDVERNEELALAAVEAESRELRHVSDVDEGPSGFVPAPPFREGATEDPSEADAKEELAAPTPPLPGGESFTDSPEASAGLATPEVQVFGPDSEDLIGSPPFQPRPLSPEESEPHGHRSLEWIDSEPPLAPTGRALPTSWEGIPADEAESELAEAGESEEDGWSVELEEVSAAAREHLLGRDPVADPAPFELQEAAESPADEELGDPYAIHLARAVDLRRRGDFEDAIRELELATQSPACFEEAYRLLQECRRNLTAAAQEEPAAAVQEEPAAAVQEEPAPAPDRADLPHAQPAGETGGEAGGRDPFSAEVFEEWLEESSFTVLEWTLQELERRGELDRARQIVERLIQLEASDPSLHQKRIEYATAGGDEDGLAQAFLELGEALEVEGRLAEARAAYFRALEYDPDSDAARRAIELVEDRAADLAEQERALQERTVQVYGPPAPAPDGSPPRATEEVGEPPAGAIPDEWERADVEFMPSGEFPAGADSIGVTPYDRREVGREGMVDFDVILAELKEQLAEGAADEPDGSSRTEVGERLRDMGLLDDAIRELQAAVRSPDAPPRAFELLGEAFIEKGQARVAARLLREALERLSGQEERKLLGVLYQLGVAFQTVDDTSKALECYERIFSVDIDYRDVRERIEACVA